METTMDKATKLSALLDSPRAAAALRKAGYETVGDLGDIALEELTKINGVGERTLEQISEAGVTKATVNYDEVEEGPQPIHLMSPRDEYVIWVLRGDKIFDSESRTNKVVPPLLIQFADGRGQIARETYLKRKYFRDPQKIQDHISADLPWRVECANWLKSRTKYGLEYTLMTD